MTSEQVLAIVVGLGLIDLGEAITYLDEEEQIEAVLNYKGCKDGETGQRKSTLFFSEERRKQMNTTRSLAFVLPLLPEKAEEWKDLGREILGPRRAVYQNFRRRLGLGVHRLYLQGTPQESLAIIYLEEQDLQSVFQEIQKGQDPFVVWLRHRVKDLLDGLDLTQVSPGSLSRLVFDGPGFAEDEASYHEQERMRQEGMINR